MARLNVFSTMVLLFLACGAVLVAPGVALEWSIEQMGDDNDISPLSAAAPGIVVNEPSEAYTLPPEPEPGFYKYLENCAEILTEECGEEIFDRMFQNTTITDDCCHKLVQMGKPCHDGLAKMMASLPEYKAYASKISQMSLEVWNQCVSVTVSSPSS